ncbi:MAG: sel1 repeat family protein [Candidatus Accumulibacter sp.]|jgi:TPR repeat protein|nr:sel1 repeat family protein [Accumulibacter sp.]
MFQSTSGKAEQQGAEGVPPLPSKIIPLKGEVSNRSQFLMNIIFRTAASASLIVTLAGCASIQAPRDNEGISGSREHQKKAAAFKKSCDGGDAKTCTNLGVLYVTGKGVKQDYARAAELYAKACDGENARGCSSLGELYANGRGVGQDAAKARELYKKACDLWNARACNRLGLMYENGSGALKQDSVKAAEIYERACEAGYAKACVNLAAMCAIGTKRDDDGKVFRLYAKACDRGHAGGCAALGALYLDGKNTKRDFLKAAEAFKKACDEGNALGCHKLGELRESGDGQNPDKALEYYGKACGLKEQRSCEAYARLTAAPTGCGVTGGGQAAQRGKTASHGSGSRHFARKCTRRPPTP